MGLIFLRSLISYCSVMREEDHLEIRGGIARDASLRLDQEGCSTTRDGRLSTRHRPWHPYSIAVKEVHERDFLTVQYWASIA